MEKKKNKIFAFIAVIILIGIGSILVPKVLQNDTFYTIKVGNYILKNGIDMLDHFSGILNLPYTYPHWLFDAIVAIFYNFGGFNGTYILTMIMAAFLSISIYLCTAKLNKNYFLALIVTLIVLWLIMPFVALRAQVITYTCFVLLIYNILKYLETSKIKYGISMLLLGIIIANVHAAVWPLIFVLFLPFLVEQLIYNIGKKFNIKIKFLQKKFIIEKEKNIKGLVIIFILLILTGFCTPIGITPFLYSILIFMGDATASIHEHYLSIFDSKMYIWLVFIPFCLFILFKRKLRLRDAFMLCGLMILAIISRRHIALFCTIGSLFIAPYFICFMEKHFKDYSSYVINYATKPVIAIIIIAVLVVPYIPMLKGKIKENAVDETEYPTKAVTYLKDHYKEEDIHVFNDFNYGSYLMLNDIKPIIDSRCDLYTKPFNKKYDYFNEYIDFDRQYYNDYQNYFNKYDINFIIVKLNSYLTVHLLKDSDYHVIYFDKYFYVFKKIEV